jgi:hypothetical protein
MSRITTSCTHCATTETRLPNQLLLAFPSSEEGPDVDAELAYRCSSCGQVSIRPLEWRQVALLVLAGVTLVPIPHLSAFGAAGVQDRAATVGPPLTPDDLLDFHRLIADRDDLVRLVVGD